MSKEKVHLEDDSLVLEEDGKPDGDKDETEDEVVRKNENIPGFAPEDPPPTLQV